MPIHVGYAEAVCGGGSDLEIIDTARLVVDVVTGKMGSDVLLLDLSGVTVIADYFVIATGDSERQLKALTDEVLEQVLTQLGLKPISVEGMPSSGWILIDYGSIVVHLFSEAQRERYQLEEFWSSARTVVRIA